MFYRFNRFRSLKTRAKQIDKIRRRSRWEWDAGQRPFFSTKHIRFASHFGSPKYHPRKPDYDSKKSKAQAFAEEDGFELTEGEKKWKEQMERMRERIEQDPYEAVFGKRFQPFWSPLLSPIARWTGEDFGVKTDSSPIDTKPSSSGSKKTLDSGKSVKSAKKDRDVDTDTPNGQLTNYSYSASTAWDSRTNKTRGQEWDSVSGVTKHFEYDPISNKMVQIQKPSVASTPSQSLESASKPSVGSPAATTAVQKEQRKAIDVPTTKVSDENKTSVYFPSLLNTSVTASPPKTSAISKASENDLDLLTAEDIRASMRGRQERAHYSTRSNTTRSATLEPALQRMQTKESPEPVEPDDSAAHESTGEAIQPSNIPRDWDKQAELLQANRVLRTRRAAKDDHVSRTPYDNDPTLKHSDFKPPTVYMNGRKVEENGRVVPYDEHARVPANNDPTYKPTAFKPPTVYMNGRKVEENGRAIDEHERTAAENDPSMEKDAKFKSPTVYMNGRKVEENGVKIPASAGSKSHLLKPVYDPSADKESRYQRKIVELKRELDLAYEQSTINSEMHVERIHELERALQKARSNESQKAKGPEHVQAEGDFDVANVTKYAKDSSKWYKQPTYQATQSSQQQSPASMKDTVMSDALARTEKEYGITYNGATRKDTKDLLKEMAEKDRQIGQSQAGRNPFPDPHSVKVDQEMAEKNKYKPGDTTKLLADYAEQDRQTQEARAGRNPFPDPLCSKVDKEMAEEHKFKPNDTKKLLAEYAEQDRQIRESRSGRNPLPDPLLAKVDKEMAEKHKYKPEDTTKLLEADAKREKEWAEYQARKSDTSSKAAETKEDAASWSIKWAEPPMYKVLAYDSGNDMFSTATTSSNFTTRESPISIQDALSQLYQPARFVPHFAELQREGYQVIYGTKDLLLFKKRQDVESSLVGNGLPKVSDTQAEPLTSLVEPISSNRSNVNPVDSTSAAAPREFGKPSYVSPGCPSPNSDSTAKAQNERQSVSDAIHDMNKLNETKQNPRVYREERVFSGRKKGGRHRSELTAEEIELLRRLKGNGSGWASRLRWALGVGVGASAVAYGVGVAVERKEARDRERWEDILEGSKYGRRYSS